MAALWPDTIVEEANLAYTVSALRKALGDGHDGEQIIQTVPTRGYRFVAAVQKVPSAPAAGPPPMGRWRRVAVGVALLAAGAIIGVLVTGGATRLRRVEKAPHVVRFELPAAVDPRHATVPAISPDGRRIVYSDRSDPRRRQLFLRSLDDLQVTPIADAPGGGSPFFSPDRTHRRLLRRVPGGRWVRDRRPGERSQHEPRDEGMHARGGHVGARRPDLFQQGAAFRARCCPRHRWADRVPDDPGRRRDLARMAANASRQSPPALRGEARHGARRGGYPGARDRHR